MSSRDLTDATPVLAQKFGRIQQVFEVSLPTWKLLVTCTLRSDAEQLQAFLSGHSQIDPRIPSQRVKARHLAGKDGKSNAIDVEVVGRASGYTADRLLALARLNRETYDLLYFVLQLLVESEGLRSGGDWNRNRVPVGPDPAEAFFDGGHMEIPYTEA